MIAHNRASRARATTGATAPSLTPAPSARPSGALGDLPPARVVLEAGPRSPWLSRLVAGLGHEAVVANPRQVALIARNQLSLRSRVLV